MDRQAPSKVNAITERSIRSLILKAQKRQHCTEDRCNTSSKWKTVWNHFQHKPLEIHPIKSGFWILLNQLKKKKETQSTTSTLPPLPHIVVPIFHSQKKLIQIKTSLWTISNCIWVWGAKGTKFKYIRLTLIWQCYLCCWTRISWLPRAFYNHWQSCKKGRYQKIPMKYEPRIKKKKKETDWWWMNVPDN